MASHHQPPCSLPWSAWEENVPRGYCEGVWIQGGEGPSHQRLWGWKGQGWTQEVELVFEPCLLYPFLWPSFPLPPCEATTFCPTFLALAPSGCTCLILATEMVASQSHKAQSQMEIEQLQSEDVVRVQGWQGHQIEPSTSGSGPLSDEDQQRPTGGVMAWTTEPLTAPS